MKTCRICNQTKPADAYRGTRSMCLACERTRALAIVKAAGREHPFDNIGDLRTAADQLVRDELGKTLSSIDGLRSGVFTDDVLKALRDGQYEAIQDLAARLPVPVSEEQIGLALAIRAFEGTSHTPEERGRAAVREYVRMMVDAWRRVEDQYEAADEQGKARVLEEFTKLRDGYASRVRAYLASHGQVMSAMIVGPARFPTERNRKRGQAADNKAQEAQEFFNRQMDRVHKALAAPVDNSPQAELQRLKANLAQRERAQELMKAANAALRHGDDEALRRLGFSDAHIAELKKPDFAGGIGYPDFRLRNNNAEIRRLRERVAQAEARVQAAQAGPQLREFAGVRIEENAQDNRLRLYFDGKPSEEVRNDLKANAFKWSPKAGAWQRQLTNNARYAARQILQKHYGTAGAATNEDRREMAAKQAQQQPQADAMQQGTGGGQ